MISHRYDTISKTLIYTKMFGSFIKVYVQQEREQLTKQLTHRIFFELNLVSESFPTVLIDRNKETELTIKIPSKIRVAHIL
jgi:hypothetical protein